MLNLEVKKCKRSGNRIRIESPFTTEGLVLLAGMGVLRGIIGAILFELFMLPFTK